MKNDKQKTEILKIWFTSKLRYSQPNLAMQTTEDDKTLFFSVGIYSYDTIFGKDQILPLEEYELLDYLTMKNKLLNN